MTMDQVDLYLAAIARANDTGEQTEPELPKPDAQGWM